MTLHDFRPANPVRVVLVQSSISPADNDSCALGARRCHQLEGYGRGGYSCPVFHRKLVDTVNPFRIQRLNLCKRGEQRNEELAK